MNYVFNKSVVNVEYDLVVLDQLGMGKSVICGNKNNA